jgi:probable HAF family extracellular repeat protein
MKTRFNSFRASLWLFIAVCIAASSVSLRGERAPHYSVALLGKLGTEYPYFLPWVINNKGEVVGPGRDGGILLYRDGVIHNLGRFEPPVWYTSITAITDRGDILGIAHAESATSFILPHPLLSLTHASMLPVPHFIARDINNHGAIVGWAWNSEEETSFPLVYHQGRVTELTGLVPGRAASALAINDHGQILGNSPFPEDDSLYASHAVIWSDGDIRDLGVLPGYPYSVATDINDRGEAVGYCTDHISLHCAFLYRRGVMAPLPFPPRGIHTYATDINDAGDVIIAAYLENEADDTYWLYSDGALHDLKSIVAQATGWPIYWLTVHGMNDRGQIIGIAHYHNGRGGSVLQGILLTPNHRRH